MTETGTLTMISCRVCGCEHVASEQFCRTINPTIERYLKSKKITVTETVAKDSTAGRAPLTPADRDSMAVEPVERQRSASGLKGTGQGRGPVRKEGDIRKPSEAAVNYLEGLLANLDRLNPVSSKAVRRMRDRMVAEGIFDAKSCSAMIDETKLEFNACGGWAEVNRLDAEAKRLAGLAAPKAELPKVPAGRYALDGTGANEVVFYRVWRGTRNPDYVGVDLLVGDSAQRVPFNQVAGILARIAADPQAAMLRYGIELGECGHCGRQLTNDESRELGIGPVCRSKMGW